MNYPVKWFSSEMPGAPVLNGHPGAVISVLDACLLNGWGLVSVDSLTYDNVADEATLTVAGGHGFIVDQVILISGANEAEFNGEQRVTWIDSTTAKFKPIHTPSVATAGGTIKAKVAPVGDWAKPFSSGDNLRAIYQSSSPDRLSSAGLYLDDSHTRTGWNTNGANTFAEVYETFTDLETRSGLVNAQSSENCFRKTFSTSTPFLNQSQQWIVVADSRLVYLFINHNTYYCENWYSGYIFGEVISYKGDDDHAYFMQTGDFAAAGSNSTSTLASMNGDWQRYLQRSYTGIGGSVGCSLVGLVINQKYMGYGNLKGVNAADNGLYINDKVILAEGNIGDATLRGELPGFGYPLHTDAPLVCGVPQHYPWRGSERKLLAVTLPHNSNTSYSASRLSQCLIDIDGSWRS